MSYSKSGAENIQDEPGTSHHTKDVVVSKEFRRQLEEAPSGMDGKIWAPMNICNRLTGKHQKS